MSAPEASGDEVEVEQVQLATGRKFRVERCFYAPGGDAVDGRWVEFVVPESASFEACEAWVGSMVEALGRDRPKS